MDVRGICELTLQTDDPGALADFYRDCLGLPELAREDDRVWLACGESSRLGLWSPGRKEHDDQGGRHVHFALSVPSGALEPIRHRLAGRGLDVRGPVEHDGGDRSLYFTDPAGNRVELWDYFARGGDVRDLGG